MAEDVKIKDRFVAAELKRRELKRIEARARASGVQPEPGLESSIPWTILDAALVLISGVFLSEEALGIATSVLGADLAGKYLKEFVSLIAPHHTSLQETADIIGNLLGFAVGNLESRAYITEKLGQEGVEQIQRAFPDILKNVTIKGKNLSFSIPSKGQEVISEIPMKQLELFAEKIKAIPQQLLLIPSGVTLGKKEILAKLTRLERVHRATKNITTAMYDAMLLNPRIALTKLITDSMFLPVQVAYRSIGAGLEYGMPAGVKNMAAALHGYREAFKEALKFAFTTFKEDRPAFQENVLNLGNKQVFGNEVFDESPLAIGFRWLHSIMGAGSRAIMSADQFAKAIAYRANKHMAAYQIALEEAVNDRGLIGAARIQYSELRATELMNGHGSRDTIEAIEQRAITKMFEDTFTDMGKMVKALSQLQNTLPESRIVLPFLRTPAALIKQGIYFSPLAPLTSSFRQDLGVLGYTHPEDAFKNIDQAIAIAKWATGFGLYNFLAYETAKGNIIGRKPAGPGGDVWQHRRHPESIHVGDHYFGYRHLGPFAQILSMSADTAAMTYQSDDESITQGLANNIMEILSSKSEDMPLLESMSNIVHAIDSLKGDETGKAAQEFLGQTFGEFIPAPVRIAAHIEDPILRKSSNAIQTFAENIPGWSSTLPAKRDRFGRLQVPSIGNGPANSASKIERLLNNISPIPVEGDIDLDAVDKELYKYGIKHESGLQTHITYKGVVVPLTPEEQEQWEVNTGHALKINGKNQHDALESLINNPMYQKSPPSIQKLHLDKTITSFRKFGEQQLMHPNTPSGQRIRMEITKGLNEMREQPMEQPSGSIER